jgi:UDP:flavonoid glycosyltransferase YjiC (YdhE family)
MLIMPYSHDQPDNARRMRRLGAARSLLRSSYTPKRVARVLRTMLAEPVYEEEAQKAAREIASENGEATACDALENLYRRKSKLR